MEIQKHVLRSVRVFSTLLVARYWGLGFFIVSYCSCEKVRKVTKIFRIWFIFYVPLLSTTNCYALPVWPAGTQYFYSLELFLTYWHKLLVLFSGLSISTTTILFWSYLTDCSFNVQTFKIDYERIQPVEEYAADIVVGDGRFLGAGRHAQRPQEVVHQDVKLLDVLGLRVQHAEHHLVPLPHALCVRRADIILDDCLPLPPADPASQEALDLGIQRLWSSSRHVEIHWICCSRFKTLLFWFSWSLSRHRTGQLRGWRWSSRCLWAAQRSAGGESSQRKDRSFPLTHFSSSHLLHRHVKTVTESTGRDLSALSTLRH